MGYHLKSVCFIVVLTIILVIASVIHTPAVEAASETQTTESVKTETKSLGTNAEIDAEEQAEHKSRAILIDEAKKQAQEAVREQEELIAMWNEEYEDYDDFEVETTSKSRSSKSTSAAVAESTRSTFDDYTDADKATSSSSSTYIAGSSNAGCLIEISNPDKSYQSYAVSLSDADRSAAERIIMGEAGTMGYNGMALVAQCLRDAYVTHGYSSISETISQYGYYASMSVTPSQQCKDVVKYIFDQGGAAVQHRILVFYSTEYCSSSWHESQNFIVSCGSVRFFDRW